MRLRGREGGVSLKIETLQKWGDLPVDMLYMTMELSVQAAPMMEAPGGSRQKASRRPGIPLGMVRKTERDIMSHTMTSEVKRRPMYKRCCS